MLCVACGGRAEQSARSEAIGGADAQNDAGQSAGSGEVGTPSADAPSLIALGCPNPAGNLAACPALEANLDFSSTSGNLSSSWVEPLQIPQFGARPPGYYTTDAPVDPASWDRSALPAGACVFRLHGVPGSCLRPGEIFVGACPLDGGPQVSPGDFYESHRCEQGVAPGCPTSNPWSSDGYWWYMVPRGADTDVVICAPECAQSFQLSAQDCLVLGAP